MTGSYFRIDSYQLTKTSESSVSGIIYFDDLRAVKKSTLTSIELPELSTPNDYRLYQNFPNPFNPSTKISWHSPISGFQTLKIYDVLGNELSTLVEEFKSAGDYEINFTTSELSSGIYFFRLTTQLGTKSIKSILLK